MKYGVPAFVRGNDCALYAAFKSYVGLYPTPTVIEKFAKELKPYDAAKGTIRFSLDKSIPYELIGEIVAFRFKKE